ncbi:MAG: DUF4290 domain-containing protein [Bacteroidales bacterium]|nr:DUF4290 domain-containing protein [Bacteroidales bacterium]
MEANENTIKLYYNTERESLAMPEYGRNVLRMVEQLKEIEDRDKRSEQARAVVKVMETLNPQVHQQENFEQKLWDHLFLIAGLDLDIDAPFPKPTAEQLQSRPEIIPLKKKPVKAAHYGRNIESIIDLIAGENDGEVKTAMIRSLAIYMRQQYLIWNKDSVADETIFSDIEQLSDGRIKVPEEISLTRISENASFARPGMSVNVGQAAQNKQGWGRKNFGKKGNRRK